jgi:hypothetical protein
MKNPFPVFWHERRNPLWWLALGSLVVAMAYFSMLDFQRGFILWTVTIVTLLMEWSTRPGPPPE